MPNFRIILTGIFFSFLIPCHGAQAANETIGLARPLQAGVADSTWAILTIQEPITGFTPACATEPVFSWDKTTQHGQDLLEIAIAAKTGGRKVLIKYDDTICGLRGSTLLVNALHII